MRVLQTVFCNTADLTNILHEHVYKKQRELQNSKKSEEGTRSEKKVASAIRPDVLAKRAAKHLSPKAKAMQAVEREAAKPFVKYNLPLTPDLEWVIIEATGMEEVFRQEMQHVLKLVEIAQQACQLLNGSQKKRESDAKNIQSWNRLVCSMISLTLIACRSLVDVNVSSHVRKRQ